MFNIIECVRVLKPRIPWRRTLDDARPLSCAASPLDSQQLKKIPQYKHSYSDEGVDNNGCKTNHQRQPFVASLPPIVVATMRYKTQPCQISTANTETYLVIVKRTHPHHRRMVRCAIVERYEALAFDLHHHHHHHHNRATNNNDNNNIT
jgi:hypothetical protein